MGTFKIKYKQGIHRLIQLNTSLTIRAREKNNVENPHFVEKTVENGIKCGKWNQRR